MDVNDVNLMAQFWADVLGYRIDAGNDGCAKLYPPEDSAAATIWLQRVNPAKAGKNRQHPDLYCDGVDFATEVARLLSLGATRADVGQTGTELFEVLADPEGNEFCLLRIHPATA